MIIVVVDINIYLILIYIIIVIIVIIILIIVIINTIITSIVIITVCILVVEKCGFWDQKSTKGLLTVMTMDYMKVSTTNLKNRQSHKLLFVFLLLQEQKSMIDELES